MSEEQKKKGGFEVEELDDELEDVAGGSCKGCDSCSGCTCTGCADCSQDLNQA